MKNKHLTELTYCFRSFQKNSVNDRKNSALNIWLLHSQIRLFWNFVDDHGIFCSVDILCLLLRHGAEGGNLAKFV